MMRRLLTPMASACRCSARLSTTTGLSGEAWAWKPPRSAGGGAEETSADVLPVRVGELFTVEEIKSVLKKGGAEDVVVLPLEGKIDTIKTFVVASGQSRLHLRRLGETFVGGLKKRKLKQAPSISGYEGGSNDDWILVDCFDTVIHLLMPSTRKALRIEEHWGPGAERPYVMECEKEEIFEKRMDRLCEEHEVDQDYYRYWDEDETALGDSALGVAPTDGAVRVMRRVPSVLDLDRDVSGGSSGGSASRGDTEGAGGGRSYGGRRRMRNDTLHRNRRMHVDEASEKGR